MLGKMKGKMLGKMKGKMLGVNAVTMILTTVTVTPKMAMTTRLQRVMKYVCHNVRCCGVVMVAMVAMAIPVALLPSHSSV